MARPKAIRSRIAAADNHHSFARRKNLVRHFVSRDLLVLLRQIIHCEMNALQLAAGHLQIPRAFGAACKQNRVKIFTKVLDRNVLANVRVRLKHNAFRYHLRSEERRVGKECRSRWSRDNLKKKKHVEVIGKVWTA